MGGGDWVTERMGDNGIGRGGDWVKGGSESCDTRVIFEHCFSDTKLTQNYVMLKLCPSGYW